MRIVCAREDGSISRAFILALPAASTVRIEARTNGLEAVVAPIEDRTRLGQKKDVVTEVIMGSRPPHPPNPRFLTALEGIPIVAIT